MQRQTGIGCPLVCCPLTSLSPKSLCAMWPSLKPAPEPPCQPCPNLPAVTITHADVHRTVVHRSCPSPCQACPSPACLYNPPLPAFLLLLTCLSPKSLRAMWPSLKPAASSDSSMRGMRLRLAMLQAQQQERQAPVNMGVTSCGCSRQRKRFEQPKLSTMSTRCSLQEKSNGTAVCGCD